MQRIPIYLTERKKVHKENQCLILVSVNRIKHNIYKHKNKHTQRLGNIIYKRGIYWTRNPQPRPGWQSLWIRYNVALFLSCGACKDVILSHAFALCVCWQRDTSISWLFCRFLFEWWLRWYAFVYSIFTKYGSFGIIVYHITTFYTFWWKSSLVQFLFQ